MSDESDDDDPANVRYHRINASALAPYLEACSADFPPGTDSTSHVKSMLTHEDRGSDGRWEDAPEDFTLEYVHNVKFQCADGRRREYTVCMDENGRAKELDTNNRGDALVSCGRWSDQDMIDNNCKNQHLKESQGSNYFFGNVVVLVPANSPSPDHEVYQNEPIHLITHESRNLGSRMIARFGEELARKKASHSAVMDMRSIDVSTYVSSQGTQGVQWLTQIYRIAPYGVSESKRQLLLSWGYDEEKIGIIDAMGL